MKQHATFEFPPVQQPRAADPASDELLVEFPLLRRTGSTTPQASATPGFRLYLLSLLLCQHFYLGGANAQERPFLCKTVEGTFTVDHQF